MTWDELSYNEQREVIRQVISCYPELKTDPEGLDEYVRNHDYRLVNDVDDDSDEDNWIIEW